MQNKKQLIVIIISALAGLIGGLIGHEIVLDPKAVGVGQKVGEQAKTKLIPVVDAGPPVIEASETSVDDGE